MKTIGLLGGMSWESTIQYYRLINEGIKARLGALHSAKILLASVDFEEVAQYQRIADWTAAADLLVRHARALESAGADVLLICANTMHKVAPQLVSALGIPLLHVADVTGVAVRLRGCRRPALLGTQFTMEEPFYRDRLRDSHALDALVPESSDRQLIHRVIYQELCRGCLLPESREEFRRIIRTLVARGADSVILGCTEIPLLIGAADSPVPVFDTTALHAAAAVDFALQDHAG